MTLNLLTVTDYPECLKPPKFLLISSDDLNNSNLVINQFIQVLSKKPIINASDTATGNQIFGVFLNQSYTSYSIIQLKQGNNLKHLKERNLFKCMDLVTDLDQFFDNQDNDQCLFNFNKFKQLLIKELKEFFKVDNIDESVPKYESKTILIDDITTLLSLNVDVTELAAFVIYLKHFCLENGVSLIVQNFLDSNGLLHCLERFDIFLNNLSDIVIVTRQLETGYSSKIDGNLVVKNYTTNTNQEYLFKATERQAKLFAPGTVQL